MLEKIVERQFLAEETVGHGEHRLRAEIEGKNDPFEHLRIAREEVRAQIRAPIRLESRTIGEKGLRVFPEMNQRNLCVGTFDESEKKGRLTDLERTTENVERAMLIDRHWKEMGAKNTKIADTACSLCTSELYRENFAPFVA